MMNSRVALVALALVATAALGLAACKAPSPSTPPPAPPVAANATPAVGATAAVAEHPELGEAAAVTEDSLTAAVTTHMQAESTRQGGSFTIPDPQQQRPLQLSLTTVHREGTRKLADGRYFACADFKGSDGQTYDLDVFMKQDLNGLTADEITIHKQNGQARYNWVRADGAWKREPVVPR
ncbi:MAG: hypothetical protein Q8O42_06700 [Acidobacteriota bacterium]|nr:hypothetical protein [Acidobacteriota bacterium]